MRDNTNGDLHDRSRHALQRCKGGRVRPGTRRDVILSGPERLAAGECTTDWVAHRRVSDDLRVPGIRATTLLQGVSMKALLAARCRRRRGDLRGLTWQAASEPQRACARRPPVLRRGGDRRTPVLRQHTRRTEQGSLRATVGPLDEIEKAALGPAVRSQRGEQRSRTLPKPLALKTCAASDVVDGGHRGSMRAGHVAPPARRGDQTCPIRFGSEPTTRTGLRAPNTADRSAGRAYRNSRAEHQVSCDVRRGVNRSDAANQSGRTRRRREEKSTVGPFLGPPTTHHPGGGGGPPPPPTGTSPAAIGRVPPHPRERAHAPRKQIGG